MEWRYAYDGDEEMMSEETGLVCTAEEDKAVQSGKDDADINVILKRFGVSGSFPVPNVAPFYGDFTEIEDYQSALNRVKEADAAFAAMSSEIRNRFDNDPAKLFDFLDNSDNYDEAGKLGLLEPKAPEPGPVKVEVVPPAAP